MGLNASNAPGGGFKSEPIAPGSYPARLVQVIDQGLQPRQYNGEDKEPAHQIMLTYELVDEFLKDENGDDMLDKPRWVSESFNLFNLSSDKAKSTERYNVLDPQHTYAGEFDKLIGTPVMVFVVQKKAKSGNRVYNNVKEIMPMRAADAEKCPGLVNEPRVFNLDEPDMDVFKSLPKWIQETITNNLEFKGSKLAELLKAEPEDKKVEPEESDDQPY